MLPTMSAHVHGWMCQWSPDVPNLAPIYSSRLSFRENFSKSTEIILKWTNWPVVINFSRFNIWGYEINAPIPTLAIFIKKKSDTWKVLDYLLRKANLTNRQTVVDLLFPCSFTKIILALLIHYFDYFRD